MATVEEVEPAVAPLAVAPALRGASRSLADISVQGITMTPTVLWMPVLCLECAVGCRGGVGLRKGGVTVCVW